jgi:D-glycero-D-manno-heptose 1,7-bisphosphate phosphatase
VAPPPRPAVFLDRDGVLNEAVVVEGRALSPTTAAELHLVPGAAGAVARLHDAGYVVVAVTNQPDVAKGLLTVETLDAMHAAMTRDLGLDRVYVCPHETADGCSCRKPEPGMLLTAAADLDLDLPSSWLVGDRWVDVAAGHAAGVRTVLVERPYSWQPTSSGSPPADLRPDVVVQSVVEAVDAILAAAADQSSR